MSIKAIEISIVIPTYNEAVRKKLMLSHLYTIKEYCEKKDLKHEIIIVLDGPTDETLSIVKKTQKDIPTIKIIDRKENFGKGYSIREGMMAAKGNIRLFTDMDGATPIYMLDDFIEAFKKGADIVIGNRKIDKNSIIQHQPKWKELLGSFGNLLIQSTLGLWGMKDTQCGFKAFTVAATHLIMPKTTVNRWGIDFEILVLAKKNKLKIIELPVEWSDSGDSLVGFKGYINTMKDLLSIKIKLIRGVYK